MGAMAMLTLLAACGGRTPDPGPPADETLERAAQVAQGALDLDQPESAARLYARALERARERDDPNAMDSMAFGQATAALAHGDAATARSVATGMREDLARRGLAVSPGLLLAEATANFRLGNLPEADRLARAVTARSEDAAATRRAWFLLGLIAGARGDAAGVAIARAALGEAAQPAFSADIIELDAVAALLRGDANVAAARAETAGALRQAVVDYRGLSRALALQGVALSNLGARDRAADLLLRAGRSAAERGEVADARLWLTQASTLGAGRPDIQSAVRQVRRDLDQRPTPAPSSSPAGEGRVGGEPSAPLFRSVTRAR